MSTFRRPWTPYNRLLSLTAILFLALAFATLNAQSTVSRKVISGGGGTTAGSGHVVRGTLSQTAVGRLTHGENGDRHDAGFWYWAYRPEAVARVWIPYLEAEVGTRLTVPINLEVTESRIPFAPRTFRARLRFNHTLLHPVGNTPACTYVDNDCVIEVTGVATTENGAIAELEFITALGDAESTLITIEEFEWEERREERISTILEHGELRLLDVCREGDEIRLIRSGPLASRLRLWPNPASERVTLEFVSTEAGSIEIRIVDLLGAEVLRIAQTDVEPQRLYRSEVDLTGIASGTYMVVYSTPSQTQSQRLLIAQ